MVQSFLYCYFITVSILLCHYHNMRSLPSRNVLSVTLSFCRNKTLIFHSTIMLDNVKRLSYYNFLYQNTVFVFCLSHFCILYLKEIKKPSKVSFRRLYFDNFAVQV